MMGARNEVPCDNFELRIDIEGPHYPHSTQEQGNSDHPSTNNQEEEKSKHEEQYDPQ